MASLFGINIKVAGTRRVKALLDRARKGVKKIFTAPDVDPKSIPRTVLRFHQERFKKPGVNDRAQKDPDRKSWARLADATRRRKNKDRNQVLTDRGKLYNALQIARNTFKGMLTRDTGYAVIGVRRVQNRQVQAHSATNRIGGATRGTVYTDNTTDVYGEYHQEGTANMPQRAFLGLGAEDVKEIEDSMKSQFDRFLGRFI